MSGSQGQRIVVQRYPVTAGLPRHRAKNGAWPAAHVLSDQLAVGANEQRFEAFYDLLLDTLARLTSMRAKGQGGADERTLAERLIPEHRLPAWAGLWEQLLRDKNEAQELNLDKKALILGAIARLEAVARG